MINFLKRRFFGLADAINIAASPFDRFERSLDTVDRLSLQEKATIFTNDIKQNWLYTGGRMYWSMKPNDLGDQAIWQGLATATFAMLGDRGTTPKLLEGQELLQTAAGDGRLCRGVDFRDGASEVDPSRVYIHKDGLRAIQQCSESSLIGHLYGFHALLTGTFPEHSTKLAELLDNLATRIVKDDFQLLDSDGTPAKHGDLRPLTSPWHLGSRKPIAVAAVGALFGLAYLATRANKYKAAYEGWTEKHLTDISFPETHILWVHPQYQDILAYMVLHMLISVEKDAEIRRPKIMQAFKAALARQWKKNCEEGNSFYTYTVQLCLGNVEQRHLLKAEQMLSEFNTDPRLGPTAKQAARVVNSTGPLGIGAFRWGPKWLRGGKLLAKQPIPAYRRPPSDIIWQRSPYELDGEEHCSYNCLDFLAAYGLGRLAGLLS